MVKASDLSIDWRVLGFPVLAPRYKIILGSFNGIDNFLTRDVFDFSPMLVVFPNIRLGDNFSVLRLT